MKDQEIPPKNPVVLVHGILRPASIFNTMSAYLSDRGWPVYALNMKQYNGTIGLDLLAKQVAEYVENRFPPQQPIDLVGLSMGGIVSRYYVQRLEGIKRVQRLITIGSPHYGTRMAYFLPLPGCLQMRPGSLFLQDLNHDVEMLEQIKFTSIWTPYDFIIVPAASAAQVRIEATKQLLGKEKKVLVFAHAMLVRNKKTLQAVVEALNEPIEL